VKGPNGKACIVGFGSYGEVKLARNTETDELVAIKFVRL
jgi:serine/threonine protein kinase